MPFQLLSKPQYPFQGHPHPRSLPHGPAHSAPLPPLCPRIIWQLRNSRSAFACGAQQTVKSLKGTVHAAVYTTALRDCHGLAPCTRPALGQLLLKETLRCAGLGADECALTRTHSQGAGLPGKLNCCLAPAGNTRTDTHLFIPILTLTAT